MQIQVEVQDFRWLFSLQAASLFLPIQLFEVFCHETRPWLYYRRHGCDCVTYDVIYLDDPLNDHGGPNDPAKKTYPESVSWSHDDRAHAPLNGDVNVFLKSAYVGREIACDVD